MFYFVLFVCFCLFVFICLLVCFYSFVCLFVFIRLFLQEKIGKKPQSKNKWVGNTQQNILIKNRRGEDCGVKFDILFFLGLGLTMSELINFKLV